MLKDRSVVKMREETLWMWFFFVRILKWGSKFAVLEMINESLNSKVSHRLFALTLLHTAVIIPEKFFWKTQFDKSLISKDSARYKSWSIHRQPRSVGVGERKQIVSRALNGMWNYWECAKKNVPRPRNRLIHLRDSKIQIACCVSRRKSLLDPKAERN